MTNRSPDDLAQRIAATRTAQLRFALHGPLIFALAAEALRRQHRITLFDTQLTAAYHLCVGEFVEMATGEGKTLAILPATIWFATNRQKTHVMTVNDYLAMRDYALIRPVVESLGFTIGQLRNQDTDHDRRETYQADIVYGVGTEFGFDYLRDQWALMNRGTSTLGEQYLIDDENRVSSDGIRQHHHDVAIVDEADSVMLDEARTALILAGGHPGQCKYPQSYRDADRLAPTLTLDRDYAIDEANAAVRLTPHGRDRLSTGPLTGAHRRRPWEQYIENALRAHHVLNRNVDYLIDQDDVQVIDRYTGRRLPGRTWSNGLHQAVQAKECVTITEEVQAEVAISRQAFFEQYQCVVGLSGTVHPCGYEFREFYGAHVAKVPLRCGSNLTFEPTRFFTSEERKLAAVIDAASALQRTGRPVLIGTRTVTDSEQLSQALRKRAVAHRVLNARLDNEEAEIVARAGSPSHVTVATNMAGRGADIPLHHESRASGGLAVLGFEHHESRRLDRQLIGRAARQGDPGSAQFFSAPNDYLFRTYAPKLGQRIEARAENGVRDTALQRAVDRAQADVEKAHYLQRKYLFQRSGELRELLRTLGNA